MPLKKKPGRREFIKATAGALAFPYIVPSSVFGANAPSNRIVMGCIGVGNQGTNNLRGFLSRRNTQVVAVCDVVTGGHYDNGWGNVGFWGREPARERVDNHYAKEKASGAFKGCAGYNDFREVLDRDDIDAVVVTTPDQWHAPIVNMAARKGKHIYCEKPMTLTIAEGQAMIDVVRGNNIVFQTGSHERSSEGTRFGCELVRNGRIGELKRIFTVVGKNNKKAPPADWKPMPIPDGFDYDMWLGPAPYVPYHKDRCLYNFRFGLDYSGGQITNYGAHCLDMAQWGNGTDDTGPIEVEDLGGEFPKDGLFTTATFVHFRALYANGVELICKTVGDDAGARFEGTEGWVDITPNGLKAEPASLLKSVIGPNEIHLYESNGHKDNFLECIKSGRETAAPVEVGHRSATICHLGNIAMMLKRKLEWDPQRERFVGDEEANRMLSKPMRGPWHL